MTHRAFAPGSTIGRGGHTLDTLGADYYDRRHTERATRRAVQALARQGYRVTLDRVA
jgi:hypothetical protein